MDVLEPHENKRPQDSFIYDVLDRTWRESTAELERVPISLWNESVFRYFFIRSFLQLNPDARCQTEWNQVDLLVQCDERNALVEFKFYRPSVYLSLCQERSHAKGGAGRKNFEEFWKCVEKLVNVDTAKWRAREKLPVHDRYLILVFAHHEALEGQRAYRYWYDPLRAPPRGDLTLLRSWDSLRCGSTGNELFCKLFSVHTPE